MNINANNNLAMLSPIDRHAALDAKVRPAVKTWVGQTFFGQMLKSSRNSVLADENSPFNGGRGGNAFGSLLDGHMAELSGSGQGGKLVDSLVKQIIGPPPTPQPPATTVPQTLNVNRSISVVG